MLTSFLFVNSQGCIDCEDLNKTESVKNKQFENYNLEESRLEKNFINQEEIELQKN